MANGPLPPSPGDPPEGGLTAWGGGRIDASGLDAISFMDNGFAWFIPGFAAGVPGLLIILVLLLQMAAGSAWLPAVRRLRGDQRDRDKRLRAWLEARPRA